MSRYVLVHGAWHGSWCWEKVVPLLQQAGHQVETLDLPGHGRDRTPIREITLATYTKRVCETLDAQAEPVILVGHSMGGIVITQVAEERPEKIQTLVYLTAFLPQNGESLLQLARMNNDSLLSPNLVANEEQGYLTFKEGAPLKEIFYTDCPDEDVARARSLLVLQAIAPMATPVRITAEHFGRLPRVYIECLRDRTISPPTQKMMYTATPCQTILSMETSHSPFFSAPRELVRHLTSIKSVSSRGPAAESHEPCSL
jgi:pimeloyl-ACP methyl ester carboxylesterase